MSCILHDSQFLTTINLERDKLMNTKRQYWAFRVHNHKDLYTEMKEGRLRQGWGYDKSHDLQKLAVDSSNLEDRKVLRNLPILNKVKKGDILLVAIPNVVEWHKLAIVEATEDWDTAYNFEIHPAIGDCGHIFPVKYIKEFYRSNINVHGDIRKTFRCNLRFWSISNYASDIEEIITKTEDDLGPPASVDEKFNRIINGEFNKLFGDERVQSLLDKVQGHYNAAEWEKVIKIGLEKMATTTDSFRVETTTNKKESSHGADLLIYLPNPIYAGQEYVIAVQVKDYEGDVNNDAVDQICKADEHFKGQEESQQLIDKIVVITKANKDLNKDVESYARENAVKIIFKEDFEALLSRMASSFITISFMNNS